ncbi:MAG TPA: WYL domain-containing protein [Longimicrobiales bacterium]|nr:WYL domain-containing protein [Longimicrobiales bacterium]
MPDGSSARDQLARLLHVLPAAAREGGARLSDLARALDTKPERIMEDIEEASSRAYYHPGGWPDDITILIESDRVRVGHAAGLDRPIRLTELETLCLSLALRSPSAETYLPDADARGDLLRRAEKHLAQQAGWVGGARGREAAAGTPRAPAVESGAAPDPEGVRRTLFQAAVERRPCAIHYVKPGAQDTDVRVVHPWAIVAAEGHWYAIGHCTKAEGPRAFRVDRILDADTTDGSFDVPDDFDPYAFLDGRRVYRSDAEHRMRVRYSPRIARWVRERAEHDGSGWQEEPDGSLLVTHPLADDGWALGHVLQYGADAEIVEPEDLRARCRGVLEGLGS